MTRTYCRWFVVLLLLASGVLGLSLIPHAQLPSSFGQAFASGGCSEPLPDWLGGGLPPESVPLTNLPPLRVATFNLHSGLGPDWRLRVGRATAEQNLRRIARRIVSAAPADSPIDVVSLNEVDFNSRRSGWFDQAAFMARELQNLTGYSYRVRRGETWRRGTPGLEVRFGNALLSRHPIRATWRCLLGSECSGISPPLSGRFGWLMRRLEEPRGVLKTRITVAGREVDLLVTHLEAFRPERRENQAAEVLARFVDSEVPTLLMGDINAVPTPMTAKRRYFAADRTHDVLSSGPLVDARVWAAARQGAADLGGWATYPARSPRWPLDAVFATPGLMPYSVRVLGSGASDHHGLAVNYQWATGLAKAGFADWRDSLQHRQWARILACDLAGKGPERMQRPERIATMTGYGGSREKAE